MKDTKDGMMRVQAVITPALSDATGPLGLVQVSEMMCLSKAQVYGWLGAGLPVTRLRRGPGNVKITVDAAELRAWLEEHKPAVWMPVTGDDLMCTRSEYRERLSMCQNMLERWST